MAGASRPVLPCKQWNTFAIQAQGTMACVGRLVLSRKQWTIHGHPSDETLQTSLSCNITVCMVARQTRIILSYKITSTFAKALPCKEASALGKVPTSVIPPHIVPWNGNDLTCSEKRLCTVTAICVSACYSALHNMNMPKSLPLHISHSASGV